MATRRRDVEAPHANRRQRIPTARYSFIPTNCVAMATSNRSRSHTTLHQPRAHLRRLSSIDYTSALLVCCVYLSLMVDTTMATVATSSTCPYSCECKWRSGKETVTCLNANLSQIPDRLDAGTQVLELTGNEIAQITHDAFARANLLNLQKIFVAKCRLKLIERFAFRKLKNLVELDLSYNILSEIPSHAFDSIPELRELKLNGNPIHRVEADSFLAVPQLVRLELRNCKISTIEYNSFRGLEMSLEFLKLDGNKMTKIDSSALTILRNLHGLELGANPWNCSCHLRPLLYWIVKENIPYDITPTCLAPKRLTNKTWNSVELDEFACVPNIQATQEFVYGVEANNITMTCKVAGVPTPNVRWILRNRMLANLTEAHGSFPAVNGRKQYTVSFQEDTSNLTILAAELQDAGSYICIAENKAGRVESVVALQVSKRPPENILSTKIIVVCIIVSTLFVLGSSAAVLCLLTFRRRKKLLRWSGSRAQGASNTFGGTRTDSYEKIEMNHKPIMMKDFGVSGQENGISTIVQPTSRKNGQYCNVPSEDDEEETILSHPKRSDYRWIGGGGGGGAGHHMAKAKEWRDNDRGAAADETDLHIPRLIEFSDSSMDQSSSARSTLKNVPPATTSLNTSTSLQFKPSSSSTTPNWSQHLMMRSLNSNQLVAATSAQINGGGSGGKGASAATTTALTTTAPTTSSSGKTGTITKQMKKGGVVDKFTVDGSADAERKYPDLLDISSVSNDMLNGPSMFCTLPRKQKPVQNNSKYFKATSESQSPLLQEHYSSGSFENSTEMLGRRFSIESYQNCYYSKRSNSFLNLTITGGFPKRNPSLPSSPTREILNGAPPTTQTKSFNKLATPLLDFSSLTMTRLSTNPQTTSSAQASEDSPSTSSTSAYDYHAAQLERFLEEYRNLQEQLCKMKETCDSIRKKEAPLRGNIGQSAKAADPVMYTAAAFGTLDEAVAANPKSLLKNNQKGIMVPGQPPDPPPYWLHRNAMLKRLQDPDFFQS